MLKVFVVLVLSLCLYFFASRPIPGTFGVFQTLWHLAFHFSVNFRVLGLVGRVLLGLVNGFLVKFLWTQSLHTYLRSIEGRHY
jgi:hypothetical protein